MILNIITVYGIKHVIYYTVLPCRFSTSSLLLLPEDLQDIVVGVKADAKKNEKPVRTFVIGNLRSFSLPKSGIYIDSMF